MKSFLNKIVKFKEWIIISISILFSFIYFILKNKALKPPDNSKIKTEIDKNSGKIEIINENIEKLKKEEDGIRKDIEVEINKSNKDESLDDFFDKRGF